MNRGELLKNIGSILGKVYGTRLRGVVLYGSEARGESEPDSDIDVLVLLEGPIRLWDDIQTITAALYPLQLDLDRTLSAIPADADEYEKGSRSLYRHAQREGIRV